MLDFRNSPLAAKSLSIRFGNRLLAFPRPRVMGIINLSPDSFFSGSRAVFNHDLLKMAEGMLAEGADFLDIGGYSTRPGAGFVEERVEMERVCAAIECLKKEFPDSLISIDTFRPEVARQAIEGGADWVNDVSGGLENEKMWEVVAEKKVPYILMHIRQNLAQMHEEQNYQNVALEVSTELAFRAEKASSFGITDIIADPGFGFSKKGPQNFELLRNLEQVHRLNLPVLVGLSRKSMIYKTLDIKPEDAIFGTTALQTVALLKGVHILRVHDVKPAVQTIKLLDSLCLQGL